MAARRGDPRGFEPARTAADHDDALGHRRRLERAEAELVLASDGGVLHAVDRHRLEQVPVAGLVDPGARTDLVVAAFARLVHPLGIRDERAHERDAVGLVAFEDAVGLLWREDAVDGEHRRVAHGLLDGVRGVDAEQCGA